MRMSPVLIGITIVLFAACQPQRAPLDVPEPLVSTETTASGDITETTYETPQQNADSLEVADAVLEPVAVRSGSSSILMGNAGVTLTMYDDYSCFYCQEFGLTDLQWILQTYVGTKKLMIERVFVPTSSAGILMAKVALCSEKQGLFTETDKALHARPITTDAQVAVLAKSVTLNLKSLQTCMTSKATAATLETSSDRAKAANITRFPAFELDTDRWIGVLTREDLQKKIENAL